MPQAKGRAAYEAAASILRSAAPGQGGGPVSLQLALYCNRQLIEEEEEEEEAAREATAGACLPQRETMAAMAVQHFLGAMAQGGASRAPLYLPRVLSLVAGPGGPEALGCMAACDEWEAAAESVPVAALLPWVGQMLTVAGQSAGRAGDVLAVALQRIGAAYPQQTYFPLHMSWPHFSPEGRRRGQHLKDTLRHPVLEEFAAALNEMTYPIQRWDCHTVAIRRALSQNCDANAERLWKDAIADCFLRSPRDGGHAGPVSLTLTACKAEAVKADHALARKGWACMTVTDFDGTIKSLNQAAHKAGDLNRASFTPQLSQFSSWFASYSARTDQEKGLDMPGLLEGICLAGCSSDPSCPKVISFASTTHVFKSKQRPKRLRFFADDFQTYEYVVKGAEDVRIDERICRLFRIMGGILESSGEASAHRLAGALRTFSVVPVSPVSGLLAFVPNTAPLLDAMVQGGNLTQGKLDAANARHAAGMKKLKRGRQDYDAVYAEAPDSAVEELLRECQQIVPWDALRTVLLGISGGAQGFLEARSRFSATLAAVSAAGYVAGVGDRHLQNFLIDKGTGELVAIDFGYSFGTAAQVLPVPELIPFRLTRCLLGALAPVGAAVLEKPLEVALASLRANKELLEGVLDVFSAEPLQEWQREGEVLSKHQGGRASSSVRQELGAAGSRHIALKVKHAAAKLKGRPPSRVLLDELEARHGNKGKVWSVMRRVVEAAAGDRASDKALAPSEQVQALLNLATSNTVLARTWEGWRPWL